jgi:cyclopropane fatty-acyl-phospholipid synthase-like methyltransferase
MEGDYYKKKETVAEYIKLAEGIDGKQLIDKLEKILSRDAQLLELGSGPGSDWKLLNELYNVTGSDNSDQFLNHLRTKFHGGTFLNLDAVTLETAQKFDGIYSNKVLHHLTSEELEPSIKRQSQILNAHGIICHSFWKGEGTDIFKGLYVNYHDERSLTEAFDPYFEIISLDEYKEFENNDSLLLIGKKR